MSEITVKHFYQIPTYIEQDLYSFLSTAFLENIPSLMEEATNGIHFLLYKKDILIGYLFVDLLDLEEISFVGAIHPDYRNQGFFKYLLSFGYKYLKKYVPLKKSSYFSSFVSYDNKYAIDILKHLGGKTVCSEYFLTYNCEKKMFPSNISLEITTDLEQLSIIHSSIFNQYKEDSFEQLSNFVDGKFYYIYNHSILVGMVHLQPFGSYTYLSAFGILPYYQNKGLGKASLDATTSTFGNIKLQVSSLNKNAYSFYMNYGFSIKSRYDYITFKRKTLETIKQVSNK